MAIQLYDLAPSPNNIKVRIALHYKGIPFERIAVNPQEREQLVEVSGQPLTPVLVDDGRVLFDSSSILRWIDANYREEGPRLFSADYASMGEIERWESHARTELFGPILAMFRLCMSNAGPDESCAEASRALNELTLCHEERLSSQDWLVGDAMSAADISAAPLICYAMVDDAFARKYPIAPFFQQHLKLGEGRERTRAWVERVMAYDR